VFGQFTSHLGSLTLVSDQFLDAAEVDETVESCRTPRQDGVSHRQNFLPRFRRNVLRRRPDRVDLPRRSLPPSHPSQPRLYSASRWPNRPPPKRATAEREPLDRKASSGNSAEIAAPPGWRNSAGEGSEIGANFRWVASHCPPLPMRDSCSWPPRCAKPRLHHCSL
jgi:hypothetical protein